MTEDKLEPGKQKRPSRKAGALREDGIDAKQESGGVILEFGDLGVEANRIRLIEAMIIDRVLPGSHAYADRLEAAMFSLPRRTVDELMATRAKLFEAHHERATLLLKGFQERYIPKGDLQVGFPGATWD